METPTVDPATRLRIAHELSTRPTGELGVFLVSQGLGDVWMRNAKGWGRPERLSRALAAADARGDLEAVLTAAAAHFSIAIARDTGRSEADALDQRLILQLVFDAWRATGDWPRARALQRLLEQQAERVDIEVVARRLDRQIGWLEQNQDGRIVLRVRGLAACDGADEYLAPFVRVIRLLYDHYAGGGQDDPRVTDDDLRSVLGLDDETIARTFGLLENEWFLFEGGTAAADGSWSRVISPNIRHFRDVEAIGGYLAVVADLARPYAAIPADIAPGPGDQSNAIPGLDHLHPEVLRVAGALFADGHLPEAVFAAFKAVEVRVRSQSGLSLSGRDLMAKAFGGPNPMIALATTTANLAADEQEGFRFVFMGAMQGIRNLGAHDFPALDQRLAGDYLAFASLLFNRLEACTRATGSRRGTRGATSRSGPDPMRTRQPGRSATG